MSRWMEIYQWLHVVLMLRIFGVVGGSYWDLSADEARSGPGWYFTCQYLAYSDIFWLVSAVASHFAFYYTDRALRNTL